MTRRMTNERLPRMERYIAVEGIEGAGKTSIQAALSRRLEESGHQVICVREPGGTELGRQLRQILLHGDELGPWTETFVFAADRSHLADRVIRPALERGAWVISDRSVYSSLAYQGVGSGLGRHAIRRINEEGLAGWWPGRVILLRVGPHTGLDRQVRVDRIGARAIGFHEGVVSAYDRLARQEPDRFAVIDAEEPFDLVLEQVWAALGIEP